MQTTQESRRGIPIFFAALISLGVLRVFLHSIDVPLQFVPIANILMCEVFLGVPLLALCYAAQDHWTPKTATLFLVSGLALQGLCVLASRTILHGSGTASDVVTAIGQIGLPIWCVGLGALLATLIKDQNLLVPIAVFLACLDMFLVFSPVGITQVVINQAPGALQSIGAEIPVASARDPLTGKVSAGSFAGPADFMFLAMFMVALFRFNMRARQTVLVVIPVLLLYMLLVGYIHVPLPALVPIGTCVLIVNWREFHLTKDEKISTVMVAFLGVALFTWGMLQNPQVVRVGPSKPEFGRHRR